MKNAIVYFNPDNMMTTGINGTIETISNYYKIGQVLRLGYSDENEDGEPYTIKGLEIFDEEDKRIYQSGDCTSKYKVEKFCLTCGTQKNDDSLSEEVVGVTISRSKLKDRQHYLEDGEKIILCTDCKEELSI